MRKITQGSLIVLEVATGLHLLNLSLQQQDLKLQLSLICLAIMCLLAAWYVTSLD